MIECIECGEIAAEVTTAVAAGWFVSSVEGKWEHLSKVSGMRVTKQSGDLQCFCASCMAAMSEH